AALATAVRAVTPERMGRIEEHAAWLREELLGHGFTIVAPASAACPAGITLALNDGASAAQLGEELEKRGFMLNFRSNHLRSRNWIQLSLLGNPARADLGRFLHALKVADGRATRTSNIEH